MLQATIKTTYVFTSIARYFCPTLIKFGVFRQIFFFYKSLQCEILGKSVQWELLWYIRTDGLMYRSKSISAFRNYTKARRNVNALCAL